MTYLTIFTSSTSNTSIPRGFPSALLYASSGGIQKRAFSPSVISCSPSRHPGNHDFGGRWHGKQIVSATWVKRSTSPLYELRGIQYDYLWWSVELPYRDRRVRAFFAGGNGGQVVMGIPELDLVVSFYGDNYNDPVLYLPQRVFVPPGTRRATSLQAGCTSSVLC